MEEICGAPGQVAIRRGDWTGGSRRLVRTARYRLSPPAARTRPEAAGGAGSGTPAGCSTPTRPWRRTAR